MSTQAVSPITMSLPRRILACLSLLAACSTTLAQTLTISTNNTPLDRKTLQVVSTEAFRRLGVELKLVTLPSERSLVAANASDVDGEGLRIAGLNEQYPNLVRVPERYTNISFVAFSKDATIALDKGWESLRAHRVAFIGGWKMFETNATVARTVHRVDKAEQMFRMLEEGRVDLVLYTRADGLALVRSLGLSSIAPLSPSLRDVDMFLYLNKRHESLVPRLTQTLREMKSDGTYNRLAAAVAAD